MGMSLELGLIPRRDFAANGDPSASFGIPTILHEISSQHHIEDNYLIIFHTR